jgi:hypothetical protein
MWDYVAIPLKREESMGASLNIEVYPMTVGEWTFDEAPPRLEGRRTADGVAITIPASLRLKWNEEYLAMVSNLRADVYTENGLELGQAVSHDYFRPSKPEGNFQANLTWRASFAALAQFEQKRNGQPPVLVLHCTADVSHLQPPPPDRYVTFATAPPAPRRNELRVRYPREKWVDLLRELKVAENILLEMPMPPARPAPWDKVWNAVLDARKSFDQGGETGWKSCVTSIRLALEAWREIEKTDFGPEKKEDWTKAQRLNQIRYALLQMAHLAAHSPASEWTRDDAQALLAMLSGLLLMRRP